MNPARQTSNATLYSTTGRRKYLTPAERLRFIAAAVEHFRPEVRTFCLLLAYTGCRVSEGLNLCSASVEPVDGSVAVRSLKKRKHRILIRQIPIPPGLVRMLQNVHGLSVPEARLWKWSRSRAWQLVKSVMTLADIPAGCHATPKGLRHGFGVHAVRSGIPLNLVQRWMGHASLSTTAIYLDVLGDEEREIAARMWQGNISQIG